MMGGGIGGFDVVYEIDKGGTWNGFVAGVNACVSGMSVVIPTLMTLVKRNDDPSAVALQEQNRNLRSAIYDLHHLGKLGLLCFAVRCLFCLRSTPCPLGNTPLGLRGLAW